MNKGKYFEEIVELIEQSIDPSAKVERDVQMPILNSQNEDTRQCDIVITTGKIPRQTITIVEVQNRSKKPTPNDVGGWIDKLNEVGAQHLICVSRKGFSKSVKERAKRSGEKVRLIKLSEVARDKIPLGFFDLKASYQEFNLDRVLANRFDLNADDLTVYGLNENTIQLKHLSSNEKIFSFDKKNLVSLKDICMDSVPILDEAGSGKQKISIDQNNPFYLFKKNVFIRLSIYLEFEWTKTFELIPIDTLSYEQNEYGVLAWLVEGRLETVNGWIHFRTPITKFEDGFKAEGHWVDKPENVRLFIKPLIKT